MVNSDVWYALETTIEPQAREAVEYALMEAGALGTEFNNESGELARVTAYFQTSPEREIVRHQLFDGLRIYGLPSSSVREIQLREVEHRDWLEEWKKTWKPIEVGERFIVAPPWSEIEPGTDRIVIRIEPGMAFGTGTHETTRLCLAAIEKYFDGSSFLDVGTGTGVLAIAAAKLFPGASITAYDIDSEAVAIARENGSLNGVDQIDFRVGSVDETTPSANLVCANLTALVIRDLLPKLVGASCGRLILSGVLVEQVEMIESALHQLGINDVVETYQAGDWIALVV